VARRGAFIAKLRQEPFPRIAALFGHASREQEKPIQAGIDAETTGQVKIPTDKRRLIYDRSVDGIPSKVIGKSR